MFGIWDNIVYMYIQWIKVTIIKLKIAKLLLTRPIDIKPWRIIYHDLIKIFIPGSKERLYLDWPRVLPVERGHRWPGGTLSSSSLSLRTHLEGFEIVDENVGNPEVLDEVQIYSSQSVRGDGAVQSDIKNIFVFFNRKYFAIKVS